MLFLKNPRECKNQKLFVLKKTKKQRKLQKIEHASSKRQKKNDSLIPTELHPAALSQFQIHWVFFCHFCSPRTTVFSSPGFSFSFSR